MASPWLLTVSASVVVDVVVALVVVVVMVVSASFLAGEAVADAADPVAAASRLGGPGVVELLVGSSEGAENR